MLEKIVVVALVVLAGAYLARRLMKKGGSACGCSGEGSSCGSPSGGCCGGMGHGLKHMSECGCSRKS
ncbi:MAG: hypothetical protein ACOZEN_08375 [Thermodesulfobacteriota bacterium]